ncbi:GILT-like protein 1 [Metopolophium dirhodum]|uniref:GILT-like protein 1 n=1 Tax=Metopolophium dirhodum TaxID=44670 RepID=UPI00298F4F09|nr:GILT-like protein 1 [Metopolophium dirhodum]
MPGGRLSHFAARRRFSRHAPTQRIPKSFLFVVIFVVVRFAFKWISSSQRTLYYTYSLVNKFTFINFELHRTFCVINWKKMESRARNAFVLLTIVFAFALQCVSAADVSTPIVNPPAPNNSASGLSAAVTPAPVNPAASPAASPAPVGVLPPSEDIAKTESAPLTNNNVSKHIVEIEVYYEALCGDSVQFVSNQLLPTFNKLSKFINVTFIPFAQGNISTNTDNSLNLTCRRSGECDADKVHACGIHKIKDSEQLIKFVNCSLTEGFNNSKKIVPIDVCGKNSNIDSAVITDIINCANNTESNPWLQEYMKKSSAAHVISVPKVIINKNSTEDFASTVPFMNAVCKQIPVELQPEDCKTIPSGSDTLVVGVLPILIGAFYFIKMI